MLRASKVKPSFDCCLPDASLFWRGAAFSTPRQLMVALKKEAQGAAGQSAHDGCSDSVRNAAKARIGEDAQHHSTNTGEDIGVGCDFPFSFARWPLIRYCRSLPSANCALPLEADARQLRIGVIWLNEMEGQVSGRT